MLGLDHGTRDERNQKVLRTFWADLTFRSEREIDALHYIERAGVVLKKIKQFQLVILVFLSLQNTAPVAVSRAEERSDWGTVSLRFEHLSSMISNRLCYLDEQGFGACLIALRVLLQFHSTQGSAAVISSKEFLSKPSEYKSVVQSFGPLVIAERDPSFHKTKIPAAEFKKTLAEERKKENAYEKDLFLNHQKVDFEAALNWVTAELRAEFQKLGKNEESRAVGEAMNGIFGYVLDPHTRLIPKAEFMRHSSTSGNAYVGIGLQLGQGKGFVFISQIAEDSPALKADLKRNDVITHVTDLAGKLQPVAGMKFDQVAEMFMGPEGSDLGLVVLRNGQSLNFLIRRQRIEIRNVSSKILSDLGPRIGYISLSDFTPESSCDEVAFELAQVEAQGIKGLILDLRENRGGLLKQAVCIDSLFLPRGKKVVTVRDLSEPGRKEVHYSKSMTDLLHEEFILKSFSRMDQFPMTQLPLIILIDANSASASEIVAGSLQDHQRAVIVGERSYGKGTVQTLLDAADEQSFLPKEVAEKLYLVKTTARFYLPSGRTNQIEGVFADLEVFSRPNPTDRDKLSFREEDYYANALAALGSPWAQPRPEMMETIQACVQREEMSKKVFTQRLDDTILPDYQLLYAEDAMRCMNRIGYKVEIEEEGFFSTIKRWLTD